jgi:hypothetical protein
MAKSASSSARLGKAKSLTGWRRKENWRRTASAAQWESYVLQIVKNPLPGVDAALVIAGSDRRGTIYGIYQLSEMIGVSPWYWWADVPVKQRKNLALHGDIFKTRAARREISRHFSERRGLGIAPVGVEDL